MILSFENFPILNDYTEGFMNPWDEDPDFPLPGEVISEEQVKWFHNFILGEIGSATASTNEDGVDLDELRQEIELWRQEHATV
jgi:hypothetical protein